MENTKIKYGYLIKQENLVSLEDKIMSGTFVLETANPFPGFYEYHQEIPENIRPHYIYFVTKEKYKLENFMRATENIKKRIEFDFSAAFGDIEIKNSLLPVIRIRRLKSFDLIEALQKNYIKEGIEFKKNTARPVKADLMIHLEKFYMLKAMSKNCYMDAHEKDICYFIVPKRINWPDFVDITQKVKYNVDVLHFDASKGCFFDDYEVKDIVRIYSNNLDLEQLKIIRKKYLENIKQLIQ